VKEAALTFFLSFGPLCPRFSFRTLLFTPPPQHTFLFWTPSFDNFWWYSCGNFRFGASSIYLDKPLLFVDALSPPEVTPSVFPQKLWPFVSLVMLDWVHTFAVDGLVTPPLLTTSSVRPGHGGYPRFVPANHHRVRGVNPERPCPTFTNIYRTTLFWRLAGRKVFEEGFPPFSPPTPHLESEGPVIRFSRTPVPIRQYPPPLARLSFPCPLPFFARHRPTSFFCTCFSMAIKTQAILFRRECSRQ